MHHHNGSRSSGVHWCGRGAAARGLRGARTTRDAPNKNSASAHHGSHCDARADNSLHSPCSCHDGFLSGGTGTSNNGPRRDASSSRNVWRTARSDPRGSSSCCDIRSASCSCDIRGSSPCCDIRSASCSCDIRSSSPCCDVWRTASGHLRSASSSGHLRGASSRRHVWSTFNGSDLRIAFPSRHLRCSCRDIWCASSRDLRSVSSPDCVIRTCGGHMNAVLGCNRLEDS